MNLRCTSHDVATTETRMLGHPDWDGMHSPKPEIRG